MTGRTHDLAAWTGLNIVFISTPLLQMSWGTLVVAIGANMIGGLFPDLDNVSGSLWSKIRGGRFLGALLAPLMGGHRMISHSIIGIILTGWLCKLLLGATSSTLLVDATVVWGSFMVGLLSHLIMDSLTKEGIPLFFPIPIKIGFPPLRFLRITTGKLFERTIIFPGLVMANGYLFWQYQDIYLTFLRDYVGTI